MSFELSKLQFTVDTEQLKDAVVMVDKLATTVAKLKTPLKGMGEAADSAGQAVEKGAKQASDATSRQAKSTDTMAAAIKSFYKEQERLAKQDQKMKDQMFKSGEAMNNEAVKAYGKYIESQHQAQKKATDASIREMERQTRALGDSAKKQQSILERQQAEARLMAKGASRGEASVLARAEARGEGADIPDIIKAQQTKRSFSGGDTFDKTISGLRNMNQELGQSREGYRQMIAYQKEYHKLQLEGNGKEASLIALNKKETDTLYRDKLRLLELYKQSKNASLDFNDPDFVTKVKAQKNALTDLKTAIREVETGFNKVAQIKRPLENIRTVDATKRRNELNYMARATSVQLGDIGVSLAGGQNPLTVFLQQGDQLRAILGGVGKDTKAMQEVMSGAFTQIITGFMTVGKAMTALIGGAFKATGDAIVSGAMHWLGLDAAVNLARKGFEALDKTFGKNTVKVFDEMIQSTGSLGTVLRSLAGIIAGGLVVGLIGMAFAYKEIIQSSKELSVALALSGGAIAINKDEALKMSAALAGTLGTSMQVAGVITEIAKSANLGKDSIAGITKASLELERYGGIAVKDTVAQYSKLADDPVKALTELALKTGDVTVGTLEHIESLVKQGKSVEAVAAAIAEMNRVNGEAANKMKSDMSPIEVLWDSMKEQLSVLKESFYKLVNSDEAINSFTLAWKVLASTVSTVVMLMRSAAALSSGAMEASSMGVFEPMEKRVALAKKTQAELAVINADWIKEGKQINGFDQPDKGTKPKIELEKQYINVMQAGAIVRKELFGAEADNNRKSVQALVERKKMEDKYNNVSNMSTEQRDKAKQAEIKRAKASFEEERKGQGIDLVESKKKELALIANIEEQFKPKKEKGNATGIKDGIDSQIKALQNAQSDKERDAKLSVDKINSEHRRGMVNDLDYINQVAEAEKNAISKSIESFTKQQGIASKKKDSLTEVQRYEGLIDKARDALGKREIDRLLAISELNEKVGRKKLDSMFEELNAISQLNKSYSSQKDSGLLDNSERKAELDFRQQLIGKTDQQKEEMTILFEEKSRLQKIDRKEIEDLKKAQEAYNDALQGSNPELKAQAQGSLDKAKLGIQTVAQGQRENVIQEKVVRLEEIKVTVTGLDQIASAFDGLSTLVGSFGDAAQTNLNTLTSSVSKLGDAYKGHYKEALKNAKAEADGYARTQKAVSGMGGAIKTLSKADKDHAKGSAEHVNAQVGGYAEMAGAAKGYFEEGSAGYEALALAEQVFRGIQLAMSIAAMAQSKTESGSMIVDSLAKTGAYIVEAATKFFAQSGWGGFVGVAAMLAVVAGLGGAFSSGGGGGGSSVGAISASGSYVGTGTQVTATGQITSSGGGRISEGATGESSAAQAEVETALEAQRTADALTKLNDSLRTAAEGMSQLETDLANVKVATQGTGRAQYELATQGMSEAERATYNYNASLRGQIMVLMDASNGTEFASDNMKQMANESVQLAIDLKEASGDIAGARLMQMQLDTVGYTEQEIAMYEHIQGQKAQIAAAEAGASAAQDAAQAERDLAQTRYDLAGRLNVLLGRQTQVQFDRATELAATTDSASISMLNLIYQLEDFNSSIDSAFALLERSVQAERKLADERLKAAKDLQSILKTTLETQVPEVSRNTAKEQLKALLALARSSGILPTAELLRPTLNALAKVSTDQFKSDIEYRIDQAIAAADIADLAGLADVQVSLEQQSIDRLDMLLESAKAQIDAIRGVDTSVKESTAAFKDLESLLLSLASAQTNAPTYTYSPPTPTTGGGGGGGGYAGGGAGSSAPTYANIAGQDNKDIVAAYREYYNRNPDESGYRAFMDSKLTGDKLMQAILGASAGAPEGQDYKTAVSKGYNPLNPIAKFLKSLTSGSSGGGGYSDNYNSFAVGINEVPYDMVANIHKGERILPAADNRELFARLQDPAQNTAVLVSELRAIKQELHEVKTELATIKTDSKKTANTLDRVTRGGDAMVTTT